MEQVKNNSSSSFEEETVIKEDKKPAENNEGSILSFNKFKNIHAEARNKIKDGVVEQLKEHGLYEDGKDDELVESIVDEITGNVRRREFKSSLFSRLRVFTLLAMGLVLMLTSFLLFQLDGKFVEKVSIKSSISQAVVNQATLNELKTVFSLKSTPTQEIFGPLFSPNSYYRVDSLTLQVIFDELIVDILTSDNLPDKNKTLKVALDQLLIQYLKVNPFEGLDANDKKDLSNISTKLDSINFKLISPEIEGVTQSLKVKNSLIREYLNSSNMSLYISLAAFVFSILIAIWQFLPTAKSSQRQLISEAIKDHLDTLNSNKKINKDT